jgi:hypothetical protein
MTVLSKTGDVNDHHGQLLNNLLMTAPEAH